MAMLGQSSFRRILLSRILIFSIPILLLGVAVTFRKARTSLLDTARQNLMESAIRKADTIQSSLEALQTSLAIASQTSLLQSGSKPASQALLTELLPQLPTDIRCLQLTDLQTKQLIASTCGSEVLVSVDQATFSPTPSEDDLLRAHLLNIDTSNRENQGTMQSQLTLEMSTPVYVDGKLRYSLTAQAVVKQLESAEPWSLLGYTVVIDQDGTFLAHPLPEWLGRNMSEASDAERYENIVSSAMRDERATRHLFDFVGDETEWLAGFTPVEIPISATETHTWVVLAVTPLDNALQGLQSITQILFILTTGLVSAHLLAMLYMARDLSRPIEQLGKYARRIHKRGPLERAPKNFKIRELNQLSGVLDNMVSRLEERARELEAAWQEAEAANQLKSEFLANTSHELRTPLNAIIGCIRLVQDGCCDTREEEREFLEQADKAAVHLLKIINDLLDIRRIEEKGLPLSVELVDLRTIIKEVIDIQAVQIQQKGLQLTVPELFYPIMVRVDPARLKQVLLNVVYNATKFTDKGGITIRTRVETAVGVPLDADEQNGRQTQEHSESWIVISVQDTGIGIDPAQQHKLFRPFVMVDGTTTRKYEGTGLGLAISRNLVEMMGGSIMLQSEGLDKGTTVEIALPIVDAPEVPSDASKVDGTPEVSTPVSQRS
ncbi:two-component sensor histidine kinase [Oscillatoria sp. FACHB-1407]|uniref:sensor histidine kinase n=1 Tax=Oscillatoria sp. FACHB-1407 TaxID=2692847 RepID=UPI001683B40B|nr:ATP-binding protein [Oscillatoria sp. FACHB-1407]MBD2464005.1 two-component sensor histidine kinase [Oscillatoria sp. FACHB-1407]